MSIRYYIDFELNGLQQTQPVRPVDGGCSISQEVEDWKPRNKFEGKYKFQNIPSDAIFDYDLLKQIELDDPFQRIIFRAEKFINNTWEEIGRGHFVIGDCDVNDDRCFMEVTPEIDDKYTCIDDIKEKDFNFLSINPCPMYMVLNPANLEFFVCKKNMVVYTHPYQSGCPRPISTGIDWITPHHNNDFYGSTLTDNVIGLPYDMPAMINGNPQLTGTQNPAYSPTVIYTNDCFYSPVFPAYSYFPNPLNNYQFVNLVNLYRIYSNKFTRGDNTGLPPNYYTFEVETTWAIETTITLNDPLTNQPISPGAGWVAMYDVPYNGTWSATKWGREAFYNNQMYEFFISENHCDSFTWDLINPYSGDPANHLDIYRGRELSDVIQGLLNQAWDKSECKYTLKSQFYQDDINPYTGQKNVFYVLNDGSDCKAPIPTQPSSWNYLTLGRLLNNLKRIHQVEWYISGNDFIIEHISYFENGYAYTPQPQAIADLRGVVNIQSGKPEIIRTNKYSYDKSNIFPAEKFTNNNYVDFDFSPLTIEYDLTIGRAYTVKTESIDFVLDFSGIYNNPSSFSSTDIVMVGYRIEVIDPINGTTARIVVNEPGYRTNEEVTNGYLCLSNLFNRFWRHQRMLLQGDVVLLTENFVTTKGKILQTVSAKDCDLQYLNDYPQFITNLGQGRKISAKHNIQLATTEITILI